MKLTFAIAAALAALGPAVAGVSDLKPFPELSAPRAVTAGPHDHFFANYFAINAWSPDNRYLLVLETDIKDRLPDGQPCTLGVVDTEAGNKFIPVTTTRCWNFQEAAMAHWMPCEKDTFVFNDLRDGKFCAVVMNWKTKKERVYPFPVSAVSEDGTWAVSINYARLYVTRPDYGYAGNGQDPGFGKVFPEDDGLWRIDLRTGEAKLIVSTASVQWMVPKVSWDGMSYLCHTVISKDMKRVYFLSRSVDQVEIGKKHFSGVNWYTTAFTCKADGTEIRRCFPDGWGSSHFNWKPNLSERDARTMIVTCKWLDKVYTHVEFTVGEEDYPRQVGGKEMNFDGHCIYTPDGNFISGDGYWDENFNRHWKMVRLADNKIKDIGTFFIPEVYRVVYCRCDLHPRWRPDGRQLGFNSVHEGSRQVYVMDVVQNPPSVCSLAKHVVFVGLDGLSGKSLRDGADVPFLRKLAAEGAWQNTARTVLPSSSAVNWASIFQAAGPELTGYLKWNSSTPVMPPPAVGANGRFPDVVSELRAQRPDAKIGYFYEWSGMGHVLDTNACTVARQGVMTNGLVAAASAWFRAERPALTMLVLDHPDHEGHSSGWGSESYLKMVRRLDDEVRALFEAVRAAGVLDETVFIVTSDHGGVDKGHGGTSKGEIERPLILWGKGVKKGLEITDTTVCYDVGATIAWLLGVKPPQSWRGRPVTSAFAE